MGLIESLVKAPEKNRFTKIKNKACKRENRNLKLLHFNSLLYKKKKKKCKKCMIKIQDRCEVGTREGILDAFT